MFFAPLNQQFARWGFFLLTRSTIRNVSLYCGHQTKTKTMAKKFRFNSKFIHDLFDEKNTIIRKSDGYKWHVVVCQWNIQHKNGWMPLNDENLSQFFDENNNFRFEEYDLVYIDYFKEFCKSELKQHGKEWLDNMPYGEAKENILKQMLGC